MSKDEDEEDETEPESDDEEGQRRYKERKEFIHLQRQKHKEEQRRQMEDSQFLPVNLDLKSFLETINIHLPSEKEGPEAKVKCILSYQGDGYPFLLTFEDELIIEKCELHTLMIEERERESMAVTKKQKKNGRHLKNDNYGLDNDMDLEDGSPDEEDYDASFVDSSIFQIDLSKIIFDTVLQKSVLFDVGKDMADLHTSEFVIYCSNEEKFHSRRPVTRNENKKPRMLLFISRSSDEALGFSKILIPDRSRYLRKLDIFVPERHLIYEPEPDVDEDEDNDAMIKNNKENYPRKPIQHREPIDVLKMIPRKTNVSSFYDFTYFAKATKAFKLAKSVKIRKDLNGITSFSILIDPDLLFEDHCSKLLQGTNIEFITLETVAIEERLSISAVPGETSDYRFLDNQVNKALLKHGYHNPGVEQMIEDDENIKVIKITGDGQVTTIDDYFKQASPPPPPAAAAAVPDYQCFDIPDDVPVPVGNGNGNGSGTTVQDPAHPTTMPPPTAIHKNYK
ncbi:unnamed protein product [Ambrosiozyma monospora]|uniref:Unnamed protein product n=1 Tax=Ambrosiozyma monospora TaxID=43982 RepID=A0A9W6YZ26_AMBMO|nr:unnamed protein product [Ambrosiozyma monospora]